MHYLNQSTGKLMLVTDSADAKQFDENPKTYKRISLSDHDRLTSLTTELKDNLRAMKKAARGRKVHVLGNGPSLKNFPGRMKDDVVIGVNAAGKLHDLDYWVLLDDPFVDIPCRKAFKTYAQRSTSKHVLRKGIAMQLALELGPEYKPYAAIDWICEPDDMANGLYWQKSSVHAAIDLARGMGAVEIVLWGVDYNDRSHFYSGEEEFKNDPYDNPGEQWTNFHDHVDGYVKLKAACDAENIRVINANPASALNVFKKANLDVVETTPTTSTTKKNDTDNPYRYLRPVCFYTVGTVYEKLAMRCVASFRTHGVDVLAVPYKGSKYWMANCMRRQALLKSLSDIYPGDTMILLDADLICRGVPERLTTFEGDVAVHHRPHMSEEHEFCAGIVVIRPTVPGMKFLDNWVGITKENKLSRHEFREQLYLKQAIECTKDLKWHDLGESYNRKPEHIRPNDGTVIVHDVASRKTRKDLR